ncbi:unnamed protein product, partial [Rotaria sp. Silwood2]
FNVSTNGMYNSEITWSGLITIILLKFIDKIVGLKIEHDEELSLDE